MRETSVDRVDAKIEFGDEEKFDVAEEEGERRGRPRKIDQGRNDGEEKG